MQNKASFFIVGKHAVFEALKNPNRKVLRLFLNEDSKKNIHRLSPKLNLLKNHKIFFKSKKEMDKYCSKEDLSHQGYVAEIEHLQNPNLKEYIKDKDEVTFACLDSVSDPRNIGSVIRSAASFNLDGLILKERNFPSESKVMYKAASGSIEHVNIFLVPNIKTSMKYLKDKNFWIYGFDSKSKTDFTTIDWKGKNVLLFGSEGYGMKKHTEKYADFLVKIIINKNIESLNISNSVSIVLHHINRVKKIT